MGSRRCENRGRTAMPNPSCTREIEPRVGLAGGGNEIRTAGPTYDEDAHQSGRHSRAAYWVRRSAPVRGDRRFESSLLQGRVRRETRSTTGPAELSLGYRRLRSRSWVALLASPLRGPMPGGSKLALAY